MAIIDSPSGSSWSEIKAEINGKGFNKVEGGTIIGDTDFTSFPTVNGDPLISQSQFNTSIIHYFGEATINDDTKPTFTLPEHIIPERYSIFIACTSVATPHEGRVVRYLPWDGRSAILAEGGVSGGYFGATLSSETRRVIFTIDGAGTRSYDFDFDLYCIPMAQAIQLTAD